MIWDPLQFMVERPAVTRRIPEFEDAAGAGNTEKKAPESTRNFLDERKEETDPAGENKNFFPLANKISNQEEGVLHFWA